MLIMMLRFCVYFLAFSLTIATQAPAADAQPTALSQSEKSALESVGPGAVEPATPANEYGEGVRPSGPRTPAEEAAGFHLPPASKLSWSPPNLTSRSP